MCVLSMVYDFYNDKWQTPSPTPVIQYRVLPNLITIQEIEDFRELLRRAREYDKRMGQENCGIEEKKEKVRQLLIELGHDASFLDEK